MSIVSERIPLLDRWTHDVSIGRSVIVVAWADRWQDGGVQPGIHSHNLYPASLEKRAMSIPLSDVTIAEVVCKGTLAAGGSDAQKLYNVWHFRRTGTSVDPDKAALALAVRGLFVTIAAKWSVDYLLDVIGIRWIQDAEDPEVDTILGASQVAGGVSTDRTPANTCVTMTLKTAKRGRNYRGRKAFGALVEAGTTKDLIAAGDVTAWDTFAALILAGVTSADPGGSNTWVPFVLSRTLSQLSVNPTTVVGADVASIIVNQNLGTMNSRKVARVL